MNALKGRFSSLPLIGKLTFVALGINAAVGVIIDAISCYVATDERHWAMLLLLRSLTVAIALFSYLAEATSTSLMPWVILFGGLRLSDIAIGIFIRSPLRFIPFLPPTVMMLACLIPLAGERGRLQRERRDQTE